MFIVIENKFAFTLLNILYHTIWLKSIEPPVGIEPDASHILGECPNH